MSSDRLEMLLGESLRAEVALPRPGCEARVLAAMAGVHPRRHPNLLTFIIVAALILLLAAGVFAAVRHFFVEGTLRFYDVRWGGVEAEDWGVGGRFFSGDLEWETDTRSSIVGDISAVSGKVVGERGYDPWPSTEIDIVVSNPDWSEEVNLTGIAGVGYINCMPKWSPDGTMIVFQHCDPVEGLLPCEAGFHLWVMNGDGSDAHQVMPEGSLPTWHGSWSPDGSRLLASMGEWGEWKLDGEQVGGIISTDIWGTDVQVLPNVGGQPAWSPDGSMIVSVGGDVQEVDGVLGQRNQLLLAKADGSDPRVLVEQFIATAEVEAHYPTEDQRAMNPDVEFWIENVQHWAGPCSPVWSPGSDQIAFLAALPFDPDGPFHKDQIEVWVYDLTTDELIRMTDDDIGQTSLSWK